jgi:predicted TPR repeat methyltransferase
LPHDDDAFADPREVAAGLIADGRARDAVARLQAAVDAGRGGLLTRIALSRALVATGDTQRAVEAAREAAQLAPDTPDALMAFGDALAADANLTGAITEYQRAARLAPDATEPQVAIARLWAEIGEWDKADQALERAEWLGADGAPLRQSIAAARAAPRLPEKFVRHLFDQFSADYDARMLGRLGYAAPAILRDIAGMYWGPNPKPRAMLDLGCGTGLSGKAFADVAKPMTGVDLSPKMLAAAKLTGLYAELVEADIETWLQDCRTAIYDTVIAADVFVYLGDLKGIFAGVTRALKPGGEFLFTVEKTDDADFALGERRRYRHSETYLRRLAAAHGLEPASMIDATLRFDAGIGIEGIAALLVKV